MNILNWNLLAPEIFLSAALSILLVYGAFLNSNRYRSTVSIQNLTLISLVITLFLIILIKDSGSFMGLLIKDELTRFVQIVVIVSSILCIYISRGYVKSQRINSFEYYVLIVFSVLGLMLLVASSDIMTLYLAVEMQSLAFYVLAAFKKNSEHSAEAGLKYFILGSLASGLLLFGFVLVYGFTGSTQLETIATILTAGTTDSAVYGGIVLGMVFSLSGFLFKLGAAPFHMWLPDVYEGSPSSVTAFFAIVPKIAIFGIMVRFFFYSFYTFSFGWSQLVMLASILSMVIGTLGAIYQNKIKRLLAYSAITHVGYILIAFTTGSPEGLQSLFLYLLIYIIMSLGMFSLILSLKTGDRYIEYLDDLKGLSKNNPMLSASIATILFSMAGIPPLAGFYSKMYVFFSAIQSSYYLLAIFGVLSSIIAAVYYLKIIKIMYFDERVDNIIYTCSENGASQMIAISFVFVCLFFLSPSLFFNLTNNLAVSFLL